MLSSSLKENYIAIHLLNGGGERREENNKYIVDSSLKCFLTKHFFCFSYLLHPQAKHIGLDRPPLFHPLVCGELTMGQTQNEEVQLGP